MRIFLRSLAFSMVLIVMLAGLTGNFKSISAEGVEPRGTITVTKFADEYFSNKSCSLREAIVAANTDEATMGCPAGSGADTIILASGTYTLSIPGASEDSCLTGDLDILGSVTIIGVGSTVTIIDGADLDRVFDVHTKASATFEALKITNGTAPAVAMNGEHGGGIRATGNLTLDDVVVSENHAGNGTNEFGNGGDGGGIYSSGTLDITDSTIQYNYAGNGANLTSSLGTAGNGGRGGGIMAAGSTTIQDSKILYNYAGNSGNGILHQQSYAGNGGHGGGIMITANTEITHTEVGDNRAGNVGSGPGGDPGNGGGIYISGSVNILTSTIQYNRPGNGKTTSIAGIGGGLMINTYGTANIILSSIYGNQGAPIGASPRGAGIFNNGTIWIINSTIFANSEVYKGGGIYNSGTANINSSTIVSNYSQKGGGIYNSQAEKTVFLSNTLISWNVGSAGGYDCEGILDSVGYNFIRDLTSKVGGEPYPIACTITGDMTGVITGTTWDPLLSSYDYHGGLTKNYILMNGSPLVNAGNPLPVGTNVFACPSIDQRGVSRPQNSRCDIGSTEATAQLTVTKIVDVWKTYPGQLITYSITVTNIGAVAGTGITVYEDLPAGLIFEGPVSLSAAHPEATLALDASDLPELVMGLNLAAGESVVVYLPVRTDMSYPSGQWIRNTARAFTALPQSEGSGYQDIRTGYRLFLPVVIR